MPLTQKVLAAVAVAVALAVPGNLLAAHRRSEPPKLSEIGGARFRLIASDARSAGARVLGKQVEDRSFTFAPGTDAASEQAVLTAVASAGPAARRLIGLVDGLVTVGVGPTGHAGAVGLTSLSRDPGYQVIVDLGPISARYGPRGVARVVLHELGHVVDHAIVPADLDVRLAAGVPLGYGCGQGVSGACSTRDERFAETFAKWAMNDIGMDLNIGYKVMPPEPSLDAWGAPLAALAG